MKWILFLLLFSLSFAHLEAGVDRKVGPYLLDAGWDPDPPSAGEPVFFAINIVNGTTNLSTDIDEVWVRFSKGEKIAYAGTMKMVKGSTSFTYEFPEPGAWEMDVRFGEYNDKVEVAVSSGKPSGADIGWLAAGFFAIVAIALLFWGKSRRK